jgi:ATP-binding cassette subfamily B (MDR/TAP) protein 1
VSWFDRKEKAPGILTNILSEDITNLNGLTSETICTIIEGALCLIAGIVGSAYYSWKMTVVCIGLIPFVMLGGIFMSRIHYKTDDRNKNDKDPYDASNALLSDVILNYRTIISLG